MNSPISRWLAETAGDAITISRNLREEAIANCRSFGLTDEEAKATTSEEVADFLSSVIASRAKQIDPAKPMVFYLWFDEQIPALRFSLVSASHGVLPFNAEIVERPSPEPIIEAFLASSYHDGIPESELEAYSPELHEPSTVVTHRVVVWSQLLLPD